MSLDEHVLLAKFTQLARPHIENRLGGLIDKHSNYVTAAIPDTSTTLDKVTAWWEFKHSKNLDPLKPRIKGTKLQNIRARKRAIAGDCWYVVYEGKEEIFFTSMVRPRDVDPDSGLYTPYERFPGADHAAVLRFVLSVHRLRAENPRYDAKSYGPGPTPPPFILDAPTGRERV